jgi:hypothetical protein
MAYVVGRSVNTTTCSGCEQDLNDLELSSEKPFYNFRLVFRWKWQEKFNISSALGLKLWNHLWEIPLIKAFQ